MNPAELDTTITIQSAGTSQDAFGEATGTWTDFATVYAKKTSRPGREFFQSSRVVDEARTYFTIRHLPGTSPLMRVVHGPDVYQIVDVLESEKRGVSMMLDCKRVVS